MTIKSSGSLALTEIQAEFGGSAPISLSEYYRNGAYVTSNNTGVPTSGQVSFNQFYNTVRQFQFTISSHVQQADLRTLALAAGWDGVAPIVATINSGVYLWSDNTTIGGLTVPSTITVPLIINNYGYIIGRGGNGGTASGVGGDGGPALVNNAANVSVVNMSGAYIAGGGGGGGGNGWAAGGGGGAGGGVGGNSNTRHTTCAGGAGGAIGQAGANGQSWGAPYTDDNYCGSDGGTGDPIGYGGNAGGGGAAQIDTGSSCGQYGGAGGGGGRILTNAIGGLGGDRGGSYRYAGREGGAGGAGNFAGGNGIGTYGQEDGAGGGGGWGAAGGSGFNGASYISGGAGGAAISGTHVSLTNSGTVWGAVA